MAGYRYHAFAESPNYTFAPPGPKTRWRRWWSKLAVRLAAEAEQAHVEQVFQAFADCAVIGPDFRVTAWTWCVNPGPREQIRFGASVVCRGLVLAERFHPGTLIVGDNVYIGDNTVISCA